MPWISKKAKAQIRARRRKKEKSGEAPKKRKLDNEEETENLGTVHKQVVNTIVIPSTATSKDARKIRKEARRAARRDGKDENLLKFVDENGNVLSVDSKPSYDYGSDDVKKEGEDIENGIPKKKRKKNTFPCINKLLEEAEAAKRAQKEKEIREAYENSIPDEIKKSYVALDCEMVGIGIDGKQSALARVSITGWNDEVLLDTFVQVPDRVTDFRTHVSGVRAKDIKFTNQNAMELHACRKKVAEIIKNKVLVGHSLKNDFSALMLDHPKAQIRDTARYKPFMRASGRNGGKLRPRKLRDLVKEHLGLIIQKEGEAHTSVEDAQATMKLYKAVREQWEKEVEKANESKNKRKR